MPRLLTKKKLLKAHLIAARHPGRIFADQYEFNSGYNAQEYKTGGHPFIVLKATEGVSHIDSMHRRRTLESHKLGLSVGHYCFVRPDHSPEITAQLFWRTVADVWGNKDFLIFDYEVPPFSNSWIRAFENELYKISKHNVIGYAPLAALLENRLNVKTGKWWVAAYPGPVPKRLPFGQVTWAHQYTEHGSTKGASFPCDLSVLVATEAILYWTK